MHQNSQKQLKTKKKTKQNKKKCKEILLRKRGEKEVVKE